jgi:hypothetical protein
MTALDRLQQMIPADIALANKALSVALLQVGGICNMTLPEFANLVSALSVDGNLTLVNGLTQPVPTNVASYYANTVATGGTGPANTIVISDMFGSSSGYNYTQPMVNTVSTLNTMDLSQLTLVYQTMTEVINGDYGTSPVIIPPGTPGEGTYSTQDAAISSGLIPVAQTEIANVTTIYPSQVANLNQYWSTMGNQINREIALQQSANINFSRYQANSKQAMYSFINELPSLGVQVDPGGTNDFIRSIADISTFTGQCVVACLQQGQNQVVLENTGTVTSINIT